MSNAINAQKQRRKVVVTAYILMIVALVAGLFIGGLIFHEQKGFFIVTGVLWLIILFSRNAKLNKMAEEYHEELRFALRKDSVRRSFRLVFLVIFLFFAGKYQTIENLKDICIVSNNDFFAGIAAFSLWQTVLLIAALIALILTFDCLYVLPGFPLFSIITTAFQSIPAFINLVVIPLGISGAVVYFSLAYTGIAIPFVSFLGFIVLTIQIAGSKRTISALWDAYRKDTGAL